MSVGVIIVNWNSGPLLERCLAALAGQTRIPDIVTVIDNGSTDHSEDCASARPGVLLVRAGKNLGFAAGNNLGLLHCPTELVALLNPDAFPEPRWLETLLRAAESHPGCAAFGSRQLSGEDPDVIDGIGDSYHFSGCVRRLRHGKRQDPEDLVAREIFSACAAAALYRRGVLDLVGGFDERFFCYVEDVDLGFRLRLAGYSARYVPEAVVLHVGSATTGGQHSDFSVYHGHRNLVWAYVKNMPGPLFWTFLPAHLLLNLAALIIFSAQGRMGVIWRAKRDSLAQLHAVWLQRKTIQRKRVASVAAIWAVLDKRIYPR